MKLYIFAVTILLLITGGPCAAQGPHGFLGTWEGLGCEHKDNSDTGFVAKFTFKLKQGSNDTLVGTALSSSLKMASAEPEMIRFEAIVQNGILKIISISDEISGQIIPDQPKESGFSLYSDDRMLFMKGKMAFSSTGYLSFRLTKSHPDFEPTIEEKDYGVCSIVLQRELGSKIPQSKDTTKADEKWRTMFAQSQSECAKRQLINRKINIKYVRELGLMRVKVDGVLPMYVTATEQQANTWIAQPNETKVYFGALSVKDNGVGDTILAICPVSATITHPAMGAITEYPQAGTMSIMVSKAFRDYVEKAPPPLPIMAKQPTTGATSGAKKTTATPQANKPPKNHGPIAGGTDPEALGRLLLKAICTNNEALWTSCIHPTEMRYYQFNIGRFQHFRDMLESKGVSDWNKVKFSRVTYTKDGPMGTSDGGIVGGEKVYRSFVVEFTYGPNLIGAIGEMTIQTYNKGKYLVYMAGHGGYLMQREK